MKKKEKGINLGTVGFLLLIVFLATVAFSVWYQPRLREAMKKLPVSPPTAEEIKQPE